MEEHPMDSYNDWLGTITHEDGTVQAHALSLCPDGEAGGLKRLKAVHQQGIDCGFGKPAVKFEVRKPTRRDYRQLSF